MLQVLPKTSMYFLRCACKLDQLERQGAKRIREMALVVIANPTALSSAVVTSHVNQLFPQSYIFSQRLMGKALLSSTGFGCNKHTAIRCVSASGARQAFSQLECEAP